MRISISNKVRTIFTYFIV